MPSRLTTVTCFAGLFALSGCFSDSEFLSKNSKHGSSKSYINNKTKFSRAAYGVAASPRVTTSRKVRKGGGRRQIGKPYKIKGKWYTPKEEPGYDRKGQASWYGPNFHGRLTANGEVYDQFSLSAAHPTFPLPSYARVTNLANGRSLIVRVNDRGPYHAKRIIDLSAKASEMLDYQSKGIANVRVQYIGQAPLHGLDHKYLMASYSEKPVFNIASRESRSTTASSFVRRPSGEVKNEMLDVMSTGSLGDDFDTHNDLLWKTVRVETDPFVDEVRALSKQTAKEPDSQK